MVLLRVCALFLVLGVAYPAKAEEPRFPTIIVFRNGEDGYKFRIPAVIRASNGDLLAFCEGRDGDGRDDGNIDLVLKRSADAGATWQSLEMVQDNETFRPLFTGAVPPITVGNPAPVVDLLDPQHPGRIWLPFTLENDRVFVTSSDDHGKTWAAPREITQEVKKPEWGWYATGPVHSIQLQHGKHRGRLVVPCDHRLGAGGADKGDCGAHAIYSDDHGRTWRLGAIDGNYEDDLSPNETTVVELNDGRLYFNTRDQRSREQRGKSQGTRAFAYSSDGGETFDTQPNLAGQFFASLSEPFDTPVVQCSLLRAASRLNGDATDCLLFCGPDSSGPTRGAPKGRSDLRLRYSTDEAASWRDGPLVHEGFAAYSDMVLLRPEQVGILFDGGSIRFTRVSLGELEKP